MIGRLIQRPDDPHQVAGALGAVVGDDDRLGAIQAGFGVSVPMRPGSPRARHAEARPRSAVAAPSGTQGGDHLRDVGFAEHPGDAAPPLP
jgi:hypothetical protein